MPTFSVIVPTFNRAGYLERALASVAAQDFPGWEVIVADDGSTDETASVTARFARANPGRCLYLPSGERQGVSHARNRAADRAQGAWLAFLDSDDEWLPDKLSRQLALTGSYAFIHGEEIWVRNSHEVPVAKRYRKTGGRIFRRCTEVCCVSPSTAVLRRDVFESLGGFREDFPVCEDFELWLRVSARFEAGLVPEPVIRKHAGHADQLSMRFKGMDYYRSKALVPFLTDGPISAEERGHAAHALLEKCRILERGYSKYPNPAAQAEVEDWARRARTAVQITHSAAERRPLSVDSFT